MKDLAKYILEQMSWNKIVLFFIHFVANYFDMLKGQNGVKFNPIFLLVLLSSLPVETWVLQMARYVVSRVIVVNREPWKEWVFL